MSSLQDIANEIDKDCAKQPDDTAASESALNELLCGCNGRPVRGAVCNYVTIGGKFCKAPEKYECKHKHYCSTCHDRKMIVVGTSGCESDGNADIVEPCPSCCDT